MADLRGVSSLFHRALSGTAAIRLSILMLGEILTHARNGDLFGNSLEALHLLLVLGGVLLIAITRTPRQEGAPSVQAGAAASAAE